MFRNGDIIETKSYFPLANHYAVVVGEGDFYTQKVAHTQPETGPVMEPLASFLSSREYLNTIKSDLNLYSPGEIEERFYQLRGEQFDLIFNNCEVFVNKLAGVEDASVQVDLWLLCFLVVILIAIGIISS